MHEYETYNNRLACVSVMCACVDGVELQLLGMSFHTVCVVCGSVGWVGVYVHYVSITKYMCTSASGSVCGENMGWRESVRRPPPTPSWSIASRDVPSHYPCPEERSRRLPITPNLDPLGSPTQDLGSPALDFVLVLGTRTGPADGQEDPKDHRDKRRGGRPCSLCNSPQEIPKEKWYLSFCSIWAS